MSINHLIDSGANPKYDIFVNGITTDGDVAIGGSVDITGTLDAETVVAGSLVQAPLINATTESQTALQNNINDVLRFPPFSINSILFDEGLNSFTNLSEIFQYVKTRKVGITGLVDTYKLTWSGETSTLPSDDAIFDFRALNDYDAILSIFAYAQSSLGEDINDVGVQVNAPDDPANDFEVQFNTTNVSSPSSGILVDFTLEIQLYRIS